MFTSVKRTRLFSAYLKFISWLRDILRWEVSGGVVAMIGGIVGGTLTSVEDFSGADICFIVSAVFAALWLLSLNYSILLRFAGILGLIGLTWFLVDHINSYSSQVYLSENPTGLVPDDLPSPSNICPGGNTITLLLGNNSFGSSVFPYTAVQVANEPVITIDRGTDNTIYVSANVRSPEGYLLARITDNKILILPQHATLSPRLNLHELSVLDEYGNVVLDVYYMNKNTIRITGIINSNGHAITVTSDGMSVDNTGDEFDSNTICGGHIGLEIQ